MYATAPQKVSDSYQGPITEHIESELRDMRQANAISSKKSLHLDKLSGARPSTTHSLHWYYPGLVGVIL
jgi:hypothetical protein